MARIPDLYRKIGITRAHPGDGPALKEYRILVYAWDRVLVRKVGRESIEYYNDIKYTRKDLMQSQMTDDQVAEAERLSRQIESEIQRGSGEKQDC